MTALVDTNVVLDVMLDRRPFATDSAAVLAAACFAAIVQLAWSHAAAHGLSGMAALAYGPAVAALLPGTGRIGELGSLLATIVPHIY